MVLGQALDQHLLPSLLAKTPPPNSTTPSHLHHLLVKPVSTLALLQFIFHGTDLTSCHFLPQTSQWLLTALSIKAKLCRTTCIFLCGPASACLLYPIPYGATPSPSLYSSPRGRPSPTPGKADALPALPPRHSLSFYSALFPFGTSHCLEFLFIHCLVCVIFLSPHSGVNTVTVGPYLTWFFLPAQHLARRWALYLLSQQMKP